MYAIVIILVILLMFLTIYMYSKNRSENSSEILSRTKRWENSLPDEATWWDNAKKSGETFVLGT